MYILTLADLSSTLPVFIVDVTHPESYSTRRARAWEVGWVVRPKQD